MAGKVLDSTPGTEGSYQRTLLWYLACQGACVQETKLQLGQASFAHGGVYEGRLLLRAFAAMQPAQRDPVYILFSRDID
jgi:hypothetical protein